MSEVVKKIFAVFFLLTHRVCTVCATAAQSWNSHLLETVYTACLDVALLILPLVVMTTTYGLISYKLWPRGGVVGGGIASTTRSNRRRDVANGQPVDRRHFTR